jgi:hypothetical protein
MGRPPLPSAIQDAKGYFESHPERARHGEPVPDKPLGPPPKHLTPDQKKLWKEFKSKMLPGIVFDSDSWLVEQIVKLMDKSRKDTITDNGATRLDKLLGRFGQSPADRVKVATGVKQPKDDLDEFLTKPKPKKPTARPAPNSTSDPKASIQ